MSTTTYPVRVDGALDDRLNRWLWLVKWILVIPHLLVLAVLWIAFGVLSLVAFFAILFTGRYPRWIFDFNVGVMRWTWRVQFYAYGALGTDRYPPFTLHDLPSYPAHLEVAYPEHLSRGLVLVKWWLLAIPHYIVVGFFVGGGTWFATRADDRVAVWGSGLIGLLVVVAAIVLLFTGSYPRSIFDLVLGMNRWALRVAAYAGLMVDQYPPFRLDMGGDDPGTTTLHQPPAGLRDAVPMSPSPPPDPAARISVGRTIALIVGVMVTLASVAGLAVGGALAGLDQGRRDSAGFITTDKVTMRTTGYALASEDFAIETGTASVPRRWFGDARVRVESIDGTPVFIGLARATDVRRYLAGVEYTTVRVIGPNSTRYDDHTGIAPAESPSSLMIWRTQASGPGEQSITWPIENGDWTLVVMAEDGSSDVAVRADVGATAPVLQWLGIAILASAGVFFVLGLALAVLAVVRRPNLGPSTLTTTSSSRSN
ncbi:DUF4389 domain-containing protein [Kribbella sp. NBC_00889]|uniref:DUF4389 domain-containing protein n=1 Tax=Kribbella sp. NBC_00889 TaxID=2975974 RepID=UPI003870D632|nr:DUF4389 domain-containing protein [Kribbella sp. NBC_00889]